MLVFLFSFVQYTFIVAFEEDTWCGPLANLTGITAGGAAVDSRAIADVCVQRARVLVLPRVKEREEHLVLDASDGGHLRYETDLGQSRKLKPPPNVNSRFFLNVHFDH